MLTRRDAMKAAIAAAMAPCVRLRKEIDRERIIAAFCCERKTVRWDLTAPFGVGSLTYATDARRMCRTELVHRREDGERSLPRVTECWNELWVPGQWIEFQLPGPESLQTHRFNLACPFCGDRRVPSGVDLTKVEWTRDGEIADRRLRRLDFDIDDLTIRDESCSACRGLEFRGPNAIELFGAQFDYTMLKPLGMIPSLRITKGKTDDVLLFGGDGFEGMVMGLHTSKRIETKAAK